MIPVDSIQAPVLTVTAFLLNNTNQYHYAHALGLTEYFISSYFFPQKLSTWYCSPAWQIAGKLCDFSIPHQLTDPSLPRVNSRTDCQVSGDDTRQQVFFAHCQRYQT